MTFAVFRPHETSQPSLLMWITYMFVQVHALVWMCTPWSWTFQDIQNISAFIQDPSQFSAFVSVLAILIFDHTLSWLHYFWILSHSIHRIPAIQRLRPNTNQNHEHRIIIGSSECPARPQVATKTVHSQSLCGFNSVNLIDALILLRFVVYDRMHSTFQRLKLILLTCLMKH
jgi:hypothetical protein